MRGRILKFQRAGDRVVGAESELIDEGVVESLDFSNMVVALAMEAPEHVKATVLKGFDALLRIRDLALARGDDDVLAILDEIGIYTEETDLTII